MNTDRNSRFAHRRLNVYRDSLELFRGVEEVAAGFPAGYADLKDQVRRAASAVVRHVAEGANRVHARDKAARFMVARGEVGECDAALEMVGIVGLAPPARLDGLRQLADRIAAMLWGLVRREQSRAGP